MSAKLKSVWGFNVQSKRDDHRLRGYQSFKRREIDDRLINDVGMPVIASVTRRLEKLGIAAQGRVEIGEPVDVILKRVAEEHCEMVVIGEERSNALCRFLARVLGIVFGSAASLATLAECPVVFAQAPHLRSRRDAVQRG